MAAAIPVGRVVFENTRLFVRVFSGVKPDRQCNQLSNPPHRPPIDPAGRGRSETEAMNPAAPLHPAAALKAGDLAVARGGYTLFSGLDIALEPGEALLLSGPNGAGKTSLLRVLGGMIRPAGGALTAPDPDDIAWLGHADGLKPSETPRQSLDFFAALYGADRAGALTALKAMGVHRQADRPSARLSRGQNRRVAIARIILSGRALWLLDEPAGPLDADGRILLAEAVARHVGAGGMVIAATHQDLDWPGAKRLDLGAAG